MNSNRRDILDRIARTIGAISHRPTLVAIEGRSAAGKTTFARELAVALRDHGRHVLEISIDDFHSPGHKQRSIARRYTPESFIDEGYAYEALRRLVIDPLRLGGARCQLRWWNSAHDVAAAPEWVGTRADTIAVVEGSCLFHPTLAEAWHYAVWLAIDWDTMIERASKRDVAWVGDVEAVVTKYREFWIPMHAHYEALTRVEERCNALIDNRDFDVPLLARI